MFDVQVGTTIDVQQRRPAGIERSPIGDPIIRLGCKALRPKAGDGARKCDVHLGKMDVD
jgi:hypothetical protein